MLNKWMGIGYLGNPPDEIRTVGNKGTSVTRFSLAVSTGWGDRKSTLWMDVTCWGKLAETACNMLQKGSLVYVEGELVEESWDDKNGEKRTKIKLDCKDWRFVGGKGSEGEDRGEKQQSKPARGREERPYPDRDRGDDDISF